MKKVILLACGSFNPPTIMHLRMFELARDHLESLRHDQHRVMCGLLSPVHDAYQKPSLVSASHRLEMLRGAVEASSSSGLPLAVSSWETDQSGWSRTRLVMDAHQQMLHKQDSKPSWMKLIDAEEDLNNAKVYLVVGDDVLQSFKVPGLWMEEDVRHMLENYGLVVISRGEGCVSQRLVYESDWLCDYEDKIHLVSSDMGNDISSTKVRLAVRRGRSILHVVPPKVITYIAQEGLYAK